MATPRTSKTGTVVTIGGYSFSGASPAQAAKLIEILGKLEPVEKHYDSERLGDSYYYWTPSSPRFVQDMSIEFSQVMEPVKRLRSLPAPASGTVACAECGSSVKPGNVCPSCGTIAPR